MMPKRVTIKHEEEDVVGKMGKRGEKLLTAVFCNKSLQG